jgi:hypothetical protein
MRINLYASIYGILKMTLEINKMRNKYDYQLFVILFFEKLKKTSSV